MNNLDILFVGYSKPDSANSNALRANCTCTLIRTSSGRNIIVDTRTAWDGEQILAELTKYSLTPSDIHIVVCTHGHSDHTGCNYLFQNAEYHFVGCCASNRDYYIDWDGSRPFLLDGENVTVEHTPGHTLSCVSVLIRNTSFGSVVGICGDLFERFEDIDDPTIWLNAGSEDAQLQWASRLRMAELCDYIIPGHGPGFGVTQEIRNKLRQKSKHFNFNN